MKMIKWLLKFILLMVIVAVAAVFVLPMVIDQQQVKQEISKRFEAKTGHSLAINGPLDWSVFPWLGLQLQQVKIGNAPGFDDQPLAQIKYLDLKVGVKPLFEQRVAVDTVTLEGVSLNLVRNEKGVGNWESMLKGAASNSASPDSAHQSSAKRSVGEDFSLDLKGLVLSDINLHWCDQQKGQDIELNGLSVKMGELLPNKPVPLTLELNLKNATPPLQVQLRAASELTYSADFKRIELPGLGVDIAAQGQGLPSQGVKLKLATDVRLDQSQQALSLSDFSIAGHDVDITGNISVTQLNTHPLLEAKLALQQTNLKKLLTLLGQTVQTADANALTRVSGEMFLHQQGQSLQIKPLKIQIDDSRLEGYVDVASFNGPDLRVEMNLDQIDLDRYLPPAAEGSEKPSADAAAGAKANKADFTALRQLKLNASFRIAQLTMNKMQMRNILLKVSAAQGVINLKPMQADLYQGKFSGDARLDVRKDVPRFQIRKHLQGIQIGPLLKDLAGEDRLTGKGMVKVDLHGSGLDAATIKRHLNGTLAFDFRDGTYKGINLAQEIRKARAAVTGEKVVLDEPAETDFAQLKASANIRDGVVHNDDFYLSSPIFRINGQGRVDLPEEKVDYLLTTKIVGSLEGQGGKADEDLLGVAIPVRIKGPWADPGLSVDIAAALQANAKSKLKQKAMEKIEEKGGADLLKGLFGK